MLKSFIKLFSQKVNRYELVIQLNDKIMPIDRGDLYEDPLIEYLKSNDIGTIVNSGTMQGNNGEISFCDITVEVSNTVLSKNEIMTMIISFLENKGAPKESFIIDDSCNNKILFGKYEGFGLYLDGITLPEQVYAECDINLVVSEIKKRLNINDEIIRHWHGELETALYFYGNNYNEMIRKIKDFIESYPLCANSRITKIA